MSDAIDWVVDIDATIEEALALGQKVREWLVDQAIVLPIPDSERALGGSELLRPGRKASGWSIQMLDRLSLRGVQITAVRTVFHTDDNHIEGLKCPHCQTRHVADDLAWSESVGAWFSKDGDETLACPACNNSSSIENWRFLELDWAFGNLSFGFNNWSIHPKLAVEIGNLLGHRVKVVHEHI